MLPLPLVWLKAAWHRRFGARCTLCNRFFRQDETTAGIGKDRYCLDCYRLVRVQDRAYESFRSLTNVPRQIKMPDGSIVISGERVNFVWRNYLGKLSAPPTKYATPPEPAPPEPKVNPHRRIIRIRNKK